ncbi:MAG: amphi-Trp domain-containing protein [Hyphomonadaceae bacterium]|jgi:amphi-Trp domain-containing protein
MARKPQRDVEKSYTRAQFVAKLRRFADSIEAAEPFVIQVAGERIHVPARAVFNIEHERGIEGEEIEFQMKWKAGT